MIRSRSYRYRSNEPTSMRPPDDPRITRTALIIQRRRNKVRVACVNRRTAGQQRMGEGRPAVVLERTEHWIGVGLVAGGGKKPSPSSLLRL